MLPGIWQDVCKFLINERREWGKGANTWCEKTWKLTGDHLSDRAKAVLRSPLYQGKPSHIFSPSCSWLCLVSAASATLPQHGSCPSFSWPEKAALTYHHSTFWSVGLMHRSSLSAAWGQLPLGIRTGRLPTWPEDWRKGEGLTKDRIHGLSLITPGY